MINIKKIPKQPLMILFLLGGLLSATYGMFFYSMYRHLFDNQPLATDSIISIIYHAMAISGIIGAIAAVIGTRVINFKQLMTYSLILQIIGTYILAFNNINLIKIGLSFYIVGYGFSISSLIVFINYYLKSVNADQRLDKIIYTIDILFFNFGLMLGAFIGILVIDFGALFLSGLVFSFLTIAVYIYGHKFLILRKSLNDFFLIRQSAFCVILVALILIAYVSFSINYGWVCDILILLITIGIIIYLLAFIFKGSLGKKKVKRVKKYLFIYYLLYISIFWIAYYMMYFLANEMIVTYSNNNLFGLIFYGGSEWVGIVNTTILILISLIAIWCYSGSKISYDLSFKFGFIFIAIGYGITMISISLSSSLEVNMTTIFAFISAITISEVIMQPLGYTLVERLIPNNNQEIFLGIIGFMMKSITPTIVGTITSKLIFTGDKLIQLYYMKQALIVAFIILFLFTMILLIVSHIIKAKI